MENQKKNTGLYVIIGVLVLVNIATLGTMWYFRSNVKSVIHQGLQMGPPRGFQSEFQPGPPQGPGGIEIILMEEINFSEDQMTAFYSLRDNHRKQTSPLLNDIQKLKEELIITIKSGDDTKANDISLQIGEKQKQLELNFYNHFKSIRNICTDKQKSKFDSFVEDMGKMMAPPIGPPPDGKIRP